MPKGAPRGGKSEKAPKKTPKKQIEELTEQNTLLNSELVMLRLDAAQLQEKVTGMGRKLLTASSVKLLEKLSLTAQSDPLLFSSEQLQQLLDGLVVKRRLHDVSVEARANELERQVTSVSFDVARMAMKMRAYESHFEDILKCSRIEDVKDHVYALRFIAAQEYRSCEVNDPVQDDDSQLSSVHSDLDMSSKVSLEIAHKLNLKPPEKRGPGNTHINAMHEDLRLYVMQELSHEAASGADWRRLAERVGISSDLIDYWYTERVSLAGARVFDEWARSPTATVRILHRHLMSPQMRCTILGKSISNFYDVN